MDRELKHGEWLDNMPDPDVLAEFRRIPAALLRKKRKDAKKTDEPPTKF
jgi:hypothetical protein